MNTPDSPKKWKTGKGRHAWSPQRVHFSDRFFQQIDVEHSNPKMYQSHKTRACAVKWALLKTSLIPFQANPQSCPYIYWGLWARLMTGGLFSCRGNSMKIPKCHRMSSSTYIRGSERNCVVSLLGSGVNLFLSFLCFFPCFFVVHWLLLLVLCLLWVCLPNGCMQPSLCHFPAKYLTYSSLVSQGGCSRFLVHVIFFCGDVRTLAHVMSLTAGTLQSRYIRILQDCPRFHTSQILLGNSKL